MLVFGLFGNLYIAAIAFSSGNLAPGLAFGALGIGCVVLLYRSYIYRNDFRPGDRLALIDSKGLSEMSDPNFDDAPQWYWAAASGHGLDREAFERSDNRFVIASGQRTLWARARREIGSDDCAWNSFGPSDGKATLADCMRVYLSSREIYGVSLNRLMLELCQVRSFARFIKGGQINLGNWISNPLNKSTLPRPAYDEAVARQLGQRIASTLNLEEDWWVDL